MAGEHGIAYLLYNGILLNVLSVDGVAQENEYDETRTDQLYIRTTISVVATYNPAAVSYAGDEAVNDYAFPPPRAGAIPPDTNDKIKFHLLQPQRGLAFVCGRTDAGQDRVVIKSPPAGCAVDANNGPRPISCSVVQFFGTRTWLVRFVIETCTVECPLDKAAGVGASTPVLLSNRWNQTHAFGEDRLTTITTRGVAIFRTDVLSAMGLTGFADYFRDEIIPPLPALGFKRTALVVTGNPQGNAIVYEAIDQEMMYSLGNAFDPTTPAGYYGVETVEAQQRYSTCKMAGDMALPNVASTLMMTVQGNNYSRRSMLTQFCLAFLLDRLPLPLPGERFDGNVHGVLHELALTENLTGRQVSLVATVLYPPAMGWPDTRMVVRGDLFFRDFIAAFNQAGQSPQPPLDLGTRGTYDGFLVTQAIKASCVNPTLPKTTGTPNEIGKAGFYRVLEGVGVVANVAATFPGSEAWYSAAHSRAPWNEHEIAATVHRESSTLTALPTAPLVDLDTGKPLTPVIRYAMDHVTVNVKEQAERVGATPAVSLPVVPGFSLDSSALTTYPQTPVPGGGTAANRVEHDRTYSVVVHPSDAFPFGDDEWPLIAPLTDYASLPPRVRFEAIPVRVPERVGPAAVVAPRPVPAAAVNETPPEP